MDKFKILEKRIIELEERIVKLEADKEYMDNLYEQAKKIVIKYNKASVIFLQRKLLIDFERAETILAELEKNGVISKGITEQPRKILYKT